MNFVLLLPLFISLHKCELVEYWNPFDPVMERIKNESDKVQTFVDEQTTNAKTFIEDQSTKMKDFLNTQKVKVESAINAGYEQADKMKVSVNTYVEEKQKMISEEINNYVQGVKESTNLVKNAVSDNTAANNKTHLRNPEEILSVPAVIAKNGYICETHTVVSEGYILNIHRIPRSKNKGKLSSNTVLLQHGLFASSADWILNGPQKALAYVLADAGYDVWMTNIRGNKYSREHAWLKINTKDYWNFSWHEVAKHDVPAVIDYIIGLKGSNTKISYIGHSMGTTIFFAMLTLRPEYNDILTYGIALAPVVFMSDIRSPLKSMAPIASNVAYMEMLYGSHEFLPKDSAFGRLYSSCDLKNSNFNICKNVMFYICGRDEKQFNKSLLPAFISNLGTGTSWKTAVHFAQEVTSEGRFQQFDHGLENLKVYGTTSPPEYDLSRITLPMTLVWAQNDLLSSEQDVKKLLQKLPETTEEYMVPFPEFNHLDYLWAVDVDTLLNDKVLQSLDKSFNDNSNVFGFNLEFLP